MVGRRSEPRPIVLVDEFDDVDDVEGESAVGLLEGGQAPLDQRTEYVDDTSGSWWLEDADELTLDPAPAVSTPGRKESRDN